MRTPLAAICTLAALAQLVLLPSAAGLTTGEERDPAKLASWSTVIVRARIAKVEPSRSLSGRPPNWHHAPKDYVWHDVTLDQAKVLWKDPRSTVPGCPARVRVYEIGSPYVWVEDRHDPSFVAGESYVLFLTEEDTQAYLVGPPHWQTVCGSWGAFQLNKQATAVRRKGIDAGYAIPMSRLRRDIAKGTSEARVGQHRPWKQHQPSGIPRRG